MPVYLQIQFLSWNRGKNVLEATFQHIMMSKTLKLVKAFWMIVKWI